MLAFRTLRQVGKRGIEESVKLLVSLLFRALAWVPDTAAITLSERMASLLIWFKADIARVSEINLAHCLPELKKDERNLLVHRSLTHTCLLVFEFAYLQHQSIHKLLEKIVAVEGVTLLQEAWQQGDGIVLFMPHFGCWEFLSVYLGDQYEISALYDPPNMSALEDSMNKTRERQGATMHPTTGPGLRGLMRGLKSGNLVVVLPDQVPQEKNSIVAPFFGQPARTMLLGKRLMQVGRPRVVMAAAWRELTAAGIRYRLRFEEPSDALFSADDNEHAAALNACIESIVRRDFAQYQWSYKRFRRVGADAPDLYRRQ